MLKSLTIENLALIGSVELTFQPGLSVITGETGAGKSVIINALALLLGERADKETIRYGFDKGTVNGIFDLSRMPAEYKKQFASYLNDTSLLSVTREIIKSGKSKIYRARDG